MADNETADDETIAWAIGQLEYQHKHNAGALNTTCLVALYELQSLRTALKTARADALEEAGKLVIE